MRNFAKSTNASENCFSWGGYKASSEKPEEPFAGRKSYRAWI